MPDRMKRILLAALRLAAVYAVGVAVLFLPMVLWRGGHGVYLGELRTVAIQSAVAFLVAFILLALARRVGFVALWGLLLTLWISEVPKDVFITAVPSWFIVWTVPALPLYIIGMVASRSSTSRLGLRAVSVGAVLWMVLFVGAIVYEFAYHPFDKDQTWFVLMARFVWLPAPLILAALAIMGIWSGTREGGGLTRA